MKRRILTLLLTLVMVLSLLPGTALAVNDSSAPAVTYADLADINGTALVPDGAGENTELTVADAVRTLLLWTGMTEQQLGSFPDDYLAQARSMGMIDADTDADAPCTLAAYRQMKAVADQMYDALHADKLQPLYMNGMAQPIFPYTTGEVTEGYSNDESDIIRYCVMSRPTTTPTTTASSTSSRRSCRSRAQRWRATTRRPPSTRRARTSPAATRA